MTRWLALAGLLLVAPAAKADPPQVVVNHQGRLLTNDDQPVEASTSLTVSLYASADATSPRWTETYQVTPLKGAYSLALGDTTGGKKPLTVDDLDAAPFLGVQVNGAALTPRLRMGATPVAVHALRADLADLATRATSAADSEKLGGSAAGDYALKAYVDQKVAAATPVGYALLAGADFTGPVTVQPPQQPAQPATKAYVDQASQAQTQALTQATGQLTSQLQGLFKSAPSFSPTSGNLPFTVASGATGLVANLNAEMLGGYKASDFVLASSAPKVLGSERLVLNFDEGSGGGTGVQDASGLGNNGTFVASSLTRTALGHNATGALSFVAGGGFVTVPDSASLDVTNNLTLEAWVFPTAYPTTGTTPEAVIVHKDGAYGLRLTKDGQLQALMQTAVPASATWTGSSPALALNAWSHVAAVYDGLQVKLYVNGSLVSFVAAPNGPLVPTTTALTVGGRAGASGSTFIGAIDEVRVSAQAKTFRDSMPRIVSTRDPRGGCPPTSGAGGELWTQTFTLTKPTNVFIAAKTISPGQYRRDFYLYLDGNFLDRDILNTGTYGDWIGGHVQWTGQVGVGTHTVSFRADRDSGCGTTYGTIDTMIFE